MRVFADRDLARLDAVASLLPNPDLFVAMYVRHEAVLAFEADAVCDDTPKDVEEVVNCVRAMNHGLARLPTRVLRPHPAGGAVRDAASGNLLIQGDNLEALEALLPFYRGRVKCIFIDAPCNTKRPSSPPSTRWPGRPSFPARLGPAFMG
jgi:Fic/DOC family N-terminal